MCQGQLQAKEDGRSQRADQKSPRADCERNRMNKIGCEGLRKEPSVIARGSGTSAGDGRIQTGIRGWRRER